jgi:hypothetical protein
MRSTSTIGLKPIFDSLVLHTARAEDSSQMPPLFATQNFEQGAVFVHSAGLANSEFM